MKIQLENIQTDNKSSFRLLHDPKLNDLFFWHFHPEYELVYIEGADGIRHVGKHRSNYQQSDLVLIGSNIPHLNFDYHSYPENHWQFHHLAFPLWPKCPNQVLEERERRNR